MKTYTVDRELALLLKSAEASGEALRLVANGSTYVVEVRREPLGETAEKPAPSDPQAILDALDKYAGSWGDLDGDELIANLYRAREEGSRRVPRS